MKTSPTISAFDVVLVSVFLAVALGGGYLKIIGTEMVAAIITGCLAFLAMRVKVLSTSSTTESSETTTTTTKKTDEKHPAEEGSPDKPAEPHHSHRILVADNGSIKVEDVDTPPEGLKVDAKP